MLITLRCKGHSELPQASVLKQGSVRIKAFDIKENDLLFSCKNEFLHSLRVFQTPKWPQTLMKRMVRLKDWLPDLFVKKKN